MQLTQVSARFFDQPNLLVKKLAGESNCDKMELLSAKHGCICMIYRSQQFLPSRQDSDRWRDHLLVCSCLYIYGCVGKQKRSSRVELALL